MSAPKPIRPARATHPVRLGRRPLLQAAAGGLLLALQARPARAVSEPPALAQLVRLWAAGRPVTEGRVRIAIEPLVENGNAVPVTIAVEGLAGPAEAVREIVVYNEKNPQRDVLRAEFSAFSGPFGGRTQVASRIRLATSQQLVALARLADGSQWSCHVDVIVTLAACAEP